MSHIKFIHDGSIAWCGSEIDEKDFVFKNIDQVVFNRLHNSKHEVCQRCTENLIKCLEDDNHEKKRPA